MCKTNLGLGSWPDKNNQLRFKTSAQTLEEIKLTLGSVSIGCSAFAGKRNSLKVKMRGRREADKHGTEGGKVDREGGQVGFVQNRPVGKRMEKEK